MTKIRYDSAASESVIGSGKEVLASAQQGQEDVATAGKKMGATLLGAGSEENQAVNRELFERSERNKGAAERSNQVDTRDRDNNEAAMPMFRQAFGNRG